MPQQWRKEFLSLKELHVIKNPRILQTLFFLLGYKRGDICERETAKLDFKRARNLINDKLFQGIGSYCPFGPKEEEFLTYQKLSWLKKNIDSVDEEKVEEQSMVLYKVLNWVKNAIELRIDDVVERRNHSAQLKKEREDAITADADRTAKMNAAEEEAKAVSDYFCNVSLHFAGLPFF